MAKAWLCLVVTTAVAAVMAAALWRPRPRQAMLLVVGPFLSWAAVVGRVTGGLGVVVLLVVPYAYLLVAAALPWERPWARWAVPATVMAGCLALATATPRGRTTLLVLALPFVVAAAALVGARTEQRPEVAAREDVGRAGAVGGAGVDRVQSVQSVQSGPASRRSSNRPGQNASSPRWSSRLLRCKAAAHWGSSGWPRGGSPSSDGTPTRDHGQGQVT